MTTVKKGCAMPRELTRHDNTNRIGTNPSADPIQPPSETAASTSGDQVYQIDQKQVVAGARALIAAMTSNNPEDRKFIEKVVAPLQDDLTRVDILVSEGRTADEAWAELDRIKKAAGIQPK